MAKVTPGFKLYLYRLLAGQLGFGKQTLLPQVEEVLAADDILPEDLECAGIQELAEACPDFLKVTVFKKGRVYVTVLQNEEWDRMLAEPADADRPAPAKKAAGGPKTWKKKKTGRKSFKPVKPGKQRRDREAAEAQAHAEEEARRAAEKEAQAVAEAAEAAEAQNSAAQLSAQNSDDLSEPTPTVAGTTAEETSPSEPPVTDTSTAEETAVEPEAPSPEAPAAPTPTRTAQDLLAAIAAQTPETTPEPEEPVDTQVAAPVEAPVAEPAAPAIEQTEVSVAEPVVQASADTVAPAPQVQQQPAPREPETVAPAAPQPAPISLTITYDPYEDMNRDLQERAEQEARERAQAEELTHLEAERTAAAAAAAVPEPTARPQASAIPLAGLPQDLANDLSCKDALLRTLYQMLPYDVEPLAVLDEDWRVARSTGSLSGSRNRVTFPLRYLHEDGTPIAITLRKTTRNASGKPWSLALVDGDDGTGTSHAAVGFEGLPAADEGAWADLSGITGGTSQNPVRALAQDMVIGTWDSFLGALATMAAPERWNYPGEGVGHASRYGILREYIALTYHRARCQERVAQSADASFAAFDTGLCTPFGDDIYACLTARKGDIPWQFAGFATAGAGELGARLAGTISPLPEPASYLSSLEDVLPRAGRMVILDLEAILNRQLGRLPRTFLDELLEGNAQARELLADARTLSSDDLAQLARMVRQDGSCYRRLRRRLDDAVEQSLRAMRASYRLAVPIYDPTENRTKLLAPLCLVEYGVADCALVLDLQPSGAYRGAAILPLPRAYACARVVSREQPSWLEAQRVL